MAGVAEQPREPLAQQDAVLGDRYPHGISALTRVPPPRGVQTRKPAAERLDPVGEAAQARPLLGVGAADAVVDDLDRDATVRTADRHLDGRCVRVLGDVGQALADDVVGGDLDGLRQPPADIDGEPNGERRTCGHLLERDREPVAGDDRGMDPAREVAQLGEREIDLALRDVQLRPRIRVGQAALEQLQVERQRHQPLLGAVVQVALEALALLLPLLDHPRTRAAHLLQARAQVDVQLRVLERDSGGSRHRGEQLRLVQQRPVVHQRSDMTALTVDQCRRLLSVAVRQADEPPVEVSVRPVLRQPVGECRRRIVEGACDRRMQLGRSRLRPQGKDEIADRHTSELRAQQPDDERDGDGRQRDEGHRQQGL